MKKEGELEITTNDPEESVVEDVIEGALESSEESEEEENRLYSTDEEHLLANPNGGIDTD